MRVITTALPKGGSGKTTCVTALAARAAKDSKRVAMIDLNADQGNLSQWWIVRGEPKNPRLFADPGNLKEDIALLRKDGWDWLFIDTPPSGMRLIEMAVLVADAVIIPVRASIFDVACINAILEMCRDHRKPYSFLRAAVDNRFKNLNREALAQLTHRGPVFGTSMSYRLAWINALTIGKTGPEIDKGLIPEIDALWSEVQRLAAPSAEILQWRAGNG